MIAPRRHSATLLTAPHGYAVEIDDALVTAVQLLWHHGIPTAFSCQGSPPSVADRSGFRGYVSLTDTVHLPRALDLLRGRPELRNIRVRRLTEYERERRDTLRRGEPVWAPLTFELDEIPGETFEQWQLRARAAAQQAARAVSRQASPPELSPAEAAEELRLLDEVELQPVCIEFDPCGSPTQP